MLSKKHCPAHWAGFFLLRLPVEHAFGMEIMTTHCFQYKSVILPALNLACKLAFNAYATGDIANAFAIFVSVAALFFWQIADTFVVHRLTRQIKIIIALTDMEVYWHTRFFVGFTAYAFMQHAPTGQVLNRANATMINGPALFRQILRANAYVIYKIVFALCVFILAHAIVISISLCNIFYKYFLRLKFAPICIYFAHANMLWLSAIFIFLFGKTYTNVFIIFAEFAIFDANTRMFFC
jgi:hypothetical protein